MKKLLTSLFVLSITAQILLAQTIIYVNASASGGNTGVSWANAYTSFQSALDRARANANSGSLYQIWVAKGTYKPSYAYDATNTSRYYHFRMINYTGIYGGFDGTETATSQRINFGSGELNETILSGDLSGNDNYSTTPWGNIAENCYHVFYHPSGLSLNSTAILDGFTLKGGNATSFTTNGGGMYNYSSSPTLVNLVIINNYANMYGGGMYNGYSSPSITNVIIRDNQTMNHGGGLCNSYSSPTIINSVICNNLGGAGGGILNWQSSSLTLNNVTISNNQGGQGGGIYNDGASATLNNCIIWGNTSSSSGKQICIWSGTITLNYSCYSNVSDDVYNGGGTVSPSNCITTDPLFVDAANRNFRITGNSPCADAGDNLANDQLYDIRGEGFDRKLNKTTGLAGTIDMGAYEYKLSVDPLPIELTSFSANLLNGKVLLNWQTATEVSNYGFEVERASTSPGMTWEKIGFVQGHGNSNSPKEYSFTDKPNGGSKFKYRLKQIDFDGKYEYSKEVEVGIDIPQEFSVSQNFPNPFNPSTNIKFSIPSDDNVVIKVFNVLGMEVVTLLNEHRQTGTYSIEFSAIGGASNLASGIYFYKVVSGSYSDIKKMILLR